VNQLLVMVNIALGSAPVSGCAAGDANADGEITVNELLAAVNNLLFGCGVTPPTPLPTLTRTRTATPTWTATPLSQIGTTCFGANQCASRFCTDGRCCDQAACGAGLRCDIFGSYGHCVSPHEAGGSCITASDCQPGLTCPGGTCRAPSPTRTSTPTRTLTFTPAPTNTVTPTPQVVHLDVGTVTGAPGQMVQVPVALHSSGFGTVATANEITYPGDMFDLSAGNCTINPAIGKTLVVSILPPPQGSSLSTARVFVQSLQDAAAIPDGPLYACTFSIKSSTLPGTYALFNGNISVFDAGGVDHLPVEGENGGITVSLVGGSG